MPRRNTFAIAAVAVLSIPLLAAAQPQIINLGALPGENSSQPKAISADGSVIVGNTGGGTNAGPAFRWNAQDGIQILSPDTQLHIRAIDAFGTRAIGTTSLGTPWWDTRVFDIGSGEFLIEDFYGVALSASGGVAAGGKWPGNRPARWTPSGGVVEILSVSDYPGASFATDISGTGNTIVGWTTIELQSRAFVWKAGGGVTLIDLRTDTESYTDAKAVSADGSTLVGSYGPSLPGPTQAYRYTTADGIMLLDPPSDAYSHSLAYCVNADGNVIGGAVFGPPSGGTRAMYWSESLGMVDLNVYLPSVGVDLTGWDLSFLIDISADGKAVTGWGLLDGLGRAFLITGLPGNTPLCPADLTGDNAVNLADLNLVLANFGTTTPDGDTNNDGVVDLADLNAVLGAFGTDCP
ncbi:MAG: hypothetical protein ACFHWZ_12040 [Phycisphaerales bacterium]